ncbi:YwqG family protein [Streptomyces sp. NPDC059740]|uniref:YwqG family protein n=1 Tax=Streptomyces sp. NPDC059740 TaxID=3346926 RepID=UPI0036585CFA
MTHGSLDALHALAERHLPSDVAARWLGLLRPAARLTAAHDTASGEGGQAYGSVGQLGGTPELPTSWDWPAWEGHGPLAFIASVDCAALPGGLDIALPGEGRLLFFYFDGQVDDGDALVIAGDRESWAGARVLYVPAGVEVSARETPAELEPYPAVPLTARTEMTSVDRWHPLAGEVFAPGAPAAQPQENPAWAEAFLDALEEVDTSIGHQIGGHARPVQNTVELEIASAVLEGKVGWDDPRLVEEAGGWLLLAQIDSDSAAGMMWGDVGTLYWLIRPRDLAERRFDRAMFTWQCC